MKKGILKIIQKLTKHCCSPHIRSSDSQRCSWILICNIKNGVILLSDIFTADKRADEGTLTQCFCCGFAFLFTFSLVHNLSCALTSQLNLIFLAYNDVPLFCTSVISFILVFWYWCVSNHLGLMSDPKSFTDRQIGGFRRFSFCSFFSGLPLETIAAGGMLY